LSTHREADLSARYNDEAGRREVNNPRNPLVTNKPTAKPCPRRVVDRGKRFTSALA
jgi:hypothetical protein